jgi:hypothetical protein
MQTRHSLTWVDKFFKTSKYRNLRRSEENYSDTKAFEYEE